MITVKGVPIYESLVEILKNIRQQVYEQQGREILHKIKESGNNIMVCCPSHNDGQERKPSCGISTVQRRDYPAGTFNCFACGFKGPFELFVSKCFGYDDTKFGETWLINNYISGEMYERHVPQIEISRPSVENILQKMARKEIEQNYVTEEELATYRFYHPYMYKRKLTNEVIEKYDVGYQKDFVFSEDWQPTEVITFPVKDAQGNCLFVSRRAIYDKTFFLPPDIQKPVYGIYELPTNCDTVVICESVINALTCVSYGVPAVALFGTGDEHQYNVLNNLPIKEYIIGLDPDRAGNKGAYKLKRALRGKILKRLIVPPGKDINDLSKEEFFQLPIEFFQG